MASVPGFLTKTFEIFSSPQYVAYCGWGPNGDTIVISQIEQFSKLVLPKYFKHSNFQSFVRQLNMYDFHKTVQDPTNGEFQHQYFRKDRPDLLALIKRKANNRATETFKKLTKGDSSDLVEYTGPPTGHGFKPVIPPSSKREGLSRKSSLDINNFEPLSYTFGEDQNVADLLSESDELLSEINQQQEQHQLFEKKLEDRLGKLEGENQMLKQLFIESHNKNAIMQEKMDRVMKTIYHVFMGAGSINGKALKNKTPSMLLTDLQSLVQSNATSINIGPQQRALLHDIGVSESTSSGQFNKLNDSKSTKKGRNGLVGSVSGTADAVANFYTSDSTNKADECYDMFLKQRMQSNESNESKRGTELNRDFYSFGNNNMAGKELSRSMPLSSFDNAASAITPPFPYLSSLEQLGASYTSPTLGDVSIPLSTTSNAGEHKFFSSGQYDGQTNSPDAQGPEYNSDRVTIILDHNEPRSEMTDDKYEQSKSAKLTKMSSLKPFDQSKKRSTDQQEVIQSKKSRTEEKKDDMKREDYHSDEQQDSDTDPEIVFNRLTENQNSTLVRLDSLEATLQSLLGDLSRQNSIDSIMDSNSSPHVDEGSFEEKGKQ